MMDVLPKSVRTFRRCCARGINRVLARYRLKIDYLLLDFEDRPLDEYTLTRIFAALGTVYHEWLATQQFFTPAESFDAASAAKEFFEHWLQTPFRGQQGGSRFNNLLWLHLIARSWRPDYIVDCGTFRGASAWALSLGSPQSRVFSYDIDLSHLALRVPEVTYTEADWAGSFPQFSAQAKTLAYFDDHVDQVRRLVEAADRGCEVAIFDDDFPVTSYFAMAPTPGVLPKLEFALDRDLKHGQVLSWSTAGTRQTYTIDRAYLDRGLAAIASTDRLPNTSLITGIQQTPYRIVALRPPKRSLK